MIDNLYKFSKNAWHVKFYKWLWNIEAYNKFPTMCPYFWSYVLTIIFIWLILPLRLCLPFIGTSLFALKDKLTAAKKANKAALIKSEVDKIMASLSDKTGKTAYDIRHSKTFLDNRYKILCSIPYKNEEEFFELIYQWEIHLGKMRLIKEEKTMAIAQARKQKIKDWTSNPLVDKLITWFVIIFTSAISAIIIIALYELGQYTLIYARKILAILGATMFTIGSIGLIAVAVFVTIEFILKPFSIWLSGLNLSPFWYVVSRPLYYAIWIPARTLATGVLIIGDMSKNWYTRNCPLIIWEDESLQEE